MSRRMVHWYRALCFGEPIAPWRDSLRDVHQDLQRQGLGSYDEWGTFYVTVPGGMRRISAWRDYVDAQNASYAPTTRPMIVKA